LLIPLRLRECAAQSPIEPLFIGGRDEKGTDAFLDFEEYLSAQMIPPIAGDALALVGRKVLGAPERKEGASFAGYCLLSACGGTDSLSFDKGDGYRDTFATRLG